MHAYTKSIFKIQCTWSNIDCMWDIYRAMGKDQEMSGISSVRGNQNTKIARDYCC